VAFATVRNGHATAICRGSHRFEDSPPLYADDVSS
jgi:hypothetical protein